MTIITSAPPEFIITDENGVMIGSSGGTSLLLTSGASDGDVLAVQVDGSLAFEAPVVTESLTDLNEWAANTLTISGGLTVRQAGGVAGTDEIQIYHDGTDGYIVPQSGNLYLSSSGSSGVHVDSSGNLIANKGYTESFAAGANGSVTGNYAVAILGSSAGNSIAIGRSCVVAANDSIGIGRSSSSSGARSLALGSYATANYTSSYVFGHGADATAANQIVFGDGSSSNFYDMYVGEGVANGSPSDFTLHATGGSGTDISGANLILAGGKPTGAGTPGQVQFQVAPSGASGTTLGTLTTVGLFDEQGLTVRQPGGVAGTDEVQIYHDGADGYIESKSGNLIVPGSTTIQGTLLCDDFSVNYGDFTINSDTLYIYFDCDTNQNMQFRSTGGASFINQLVAKGTLIARQNGGVAGTDEVQIYHDGTNAYVQSQSGNLYLSSSGSSGVYVDSSGNLIANKGKTGATAIGYNPTVDQYGTVVGYESEAEDFSVVVGSRSIDGNSVGRNVLIGPNIQVSGVNNVIIGSENKNHGAISSTKIIARADSMTGVGSNQFIGGGINSPTYDVFFGHGPQHTSPADYAIHGTGGSGTDISGANLIHAGGRGTGSGLGGEVVIQHAPAGSTGTTLNTLEDIAFFGETIRFNNGNKVSISDHDFVPNASNGLFTISYNNEPNAIIELENNGGSGNYGSTRIYAKGDAAGFIIDNNKYQGTATHHDYSARTASRLETSNSSLMSATTFDVKAKTVADGSTWTSGLKYTWEDGLQVAGVLYARQYGGVAGTDEVQIYHDGTNAHVDSQSGDLIFNNSNAKVNSSGEFTNNAGYADTEVFGSGVTNVGTKNVVIGALANAGDRSNVLVGYNTYGAATSNTCVGSSARSSGFYAVLLGAGVTSTSGYNINIGYNSTNSVFGTCLIGSEQILDFYWGDGITDTVPQDATLHATGGSGTDISGANLILAGGKPTGAGTPGQVQFQVAPAGASGTTLGTLTTVGVFDEQGLTVRQAGGVAGTDEVQIYHDGSNSYVDAQSGDLIFNNSTARVTASGEFANGDIGQTLFGVGASSNRNDGITVFGESSTANSQDGQTVFGKGNTASGNRSVTIGVELTNAYRSIVIGSYVSSTANNQLVIARNDGAYSISEVYIGNGVTDSTPIDTTYHGTGGSGTDIDGANLILAGGKPTGAGTPGQVQFQVAPSGASGTTLGTLATVGLFDEQGLTVRQAGGVAGTDELQIYHDGSSGYIKNQSGPLVVGQETYVNGSIVIKNASGNNEYHAQQFHWFYDSGVNIWRMADGALTPAPGHTAWIGHLDATYGDGLQYVTWQELSSDPADPDEGRSCIWQSDGTGSGDDGDIMVKITAGGVTKTTTLVDFSTL